MRWSLISKDLLTLKIVMLRLEPLSPQKIDLSIPVTVTASCKSLPLPTLVLSQMIHTTWGQERSKG